MGMKKKAGKSRETLVVGSKVKGYIKTKKFKCSGELVDALSETVRRALDGAMKRCEGNKRSTVRPVDL
jgi:hypothetical protein